MKFFKDDGVLFFQDKNNRKRKYCYEFTGGSMKKAALVLEGGGLRTLYTSGVLDIFMEHNIEFECVIGVSAGALNAANYISKQRGRSARINIIHSNDPEYYGLKQFFFKRDAFNFDFLFNNPINILYPYDEEMLINSNQRIYIAATQGSKSDATK